MRSGRRNAFWGLALCGVFSIAAPARADVVTEWNELTFRVSLIGGASSLNAGRVAAIVQAAVFDALNGIDRRYTPVHVAPPDSCSGASRPAAAVQAAYEILSRVYGASATAANQQPTLDGRYAASLAGIRARERAASVDKGIACGHEVATEIWNWRSADGLNTPLPPFVGSPTPGQWRSTPTDPYPGAPQPMTGLPYATMTTWVVPDHAFYQILPGPPALGSAQYLRDLAETQTMGSRTSAARTADQTTRAWLWAASSAGYLWNAVTRQLIEARAHDRDQGADRGDRSRDASESRGGDRDRLLENARLLAALNVAMADASIGCWDQKVKYNFWRPITAIRESSDATWTPLFATPAHQDYPSGHSCISGAATAILADEFGEKTPFTLRSDVLVGVARAFRGFSQALEDVKDARVFAGIHFRTACDDGTVLGKAVAQYVLDNAFQGQR
jgi:PAP2 superfamily protein